MRRPRKPRPPSRAAVEAFKDGYRFGVSGIALNSTDPLIDLLSRLTILLEQVAIDFDSEQLAEVPVIVRKRLSETMAETRRARFEVGEAEALRMWELERALP